MMGRMCVTVGAKSNQPSALRSKSSAASVFHYSTVVFNFFMSPTVIYVPPLQQTNPDACLFETRASFEKYFDSHEEPRSSLPLSLYSSRNLTPPFRRPSLIFQVERRRRRQWNHAGRERERERSSKGFLSLSTLSIYATNKQIA